MNDGNTFLLGLAIGLVAGLLILTLVNQSPKLRQQAVELGYARYNATNGDWEWITNR